MLFTETAEPAIGGLRVAPARDKVIADETNRVDGTLKPRHLPGDPDDDPVEAVEAVSVASVRRWPMDLLGEVPAEVQAPLPDRFMRCRDAAGGEPILDRAWALAMRRLGGNRKQSVTASLTMPARSSMASETRVPARFHSSPLRGNPPPAKVDLDQRDGDLN